MKEKFCSFFLALRKLRTTSKRWIVCVKPSFRGKNKRSGRERKADESDSRTEAKKDGIHLGFGVLLMFLEGSENMLRTDHKRD